MNIEKRLSNLENLVNGLIKNANNTKYYTASDVIGCRQADSNLRENIVGAEQEITDQDLALLEAEQEITDMDLRIMELENAQENV